MKVNSAQPPPQTKALLTVGFCVNCEGEAQLIAAGVDPDLIWMRGGGAESLKWAINYLRGRSGMVCVADDLRIFGDSRKAISAQMAAFHVQGVIVRDVVRDENNPHVLTQAAFEAMAKSAGMRNHRTARRRGSLGGKSKAVAAELARAIRIDPEIARRLWSLKEITQKTKLWVLGEGFTLSSCQRHFT